MKILILGAAGQIGSLVTRYLLDQTDHSLVLYARRSSRRIKVSDAERVQLVDGDFTDSATLVQAMQGVDVVYVNAMGHKETMEIIVAAMQKVGVKQVIGACILGIYDEVPGAFGQWNKQMVGSPRIRSQAESARVMEDSGLDYTLLRLTWLYNHQGNKDYILTQKGEPFQGAQVTRQAVAQLVVDIIEDQTGQYSRTSLGVSEPNTDWDKPSFY